MSNVYYQNNKEKMRAKAAHNNGGNNQSYQLLNKKEVRIAADYTCQRCGKKAYGHQLVIHHVIPCERLIERNDEVDNLVCLCNSCHQSLHYLIKDITDLDELKDFTFKYINGEIDSIKEKSNNYRQIARARQAEINEIKEKLSELKIKRKRLIKFRDQCITDRRNTKYIDRWRDIGNLISHAKSDLSDINFMIKTLTNRLNELQDQKHNR